MAQHGSGAAEPPRHQEACAAATTSAAPPRLSSTFLIPHGCRCFLAVLLSTERLLLLLLLWWRFANPKKALDLIISFPKMAKKKEPPRTKKEVPLLTKVRNHPVRKTPRSRLSVQVVVEVEEVTIKTTTTAITTTITIAGLPLPCCWPWPTSCKSKLPSSRMRSAAIPSAAAAAAIATAPRNHLARLFAPAAAARHCQSRDHRHAQRRTLGAGPRLRQAARDWIGAARRNTTSGSGISSSSHSPNQQSQFYEQSGTNVEGLDDHSDEAAAASTTTQTHTAAARTRRSFTASPLVLWTPLNANSTRRNAASDDRRSRTCRSSIPPTILWRANCSASCRDSCWRASCTA